MKHLFVVCSWFVHFHFEASSSRPLQVEGSSASFKLRLEMRLIEVTIKSETGDCRCAIPFCSLCRIRD